MSDGKDFFDLIDHEKYLKCPKCSAAGLYCTEHRAEVEEILERYYNQD